MLGPARPDLNDLLLLLLSGLLVTDSDLTASSLEFPLLGNDFSLENTVLARPIESTLVVFLQLRDLFLIVKWTDIGNSRSFKLELIVIHFDQLVLIALS